MPLSNASQNPGQDADRPADRLRINCTLFGPDATRWRRWTRERGRSDRELVCRFIDMVNGMEISRARSMGLD